MKSAFEPGWLNRYPLLQKVVKILQTEQVEAYLVGGAVRDLLLEREEITDLDFAVPGDGLAVARRVADALPAAFYPLDVQRGTGRVVYNVSSARGSQKYYLDFATFRGPTLLADLADRDFTINAIALTLTDPPRLIDPLQGWQDLKTGQVKATSDTALTQDPVRVLRAIRLAVQFGFVIETQTRQALPQTAPRLASVSAERQRDELLKLLNTPAPDQAVRSLHYLGVLPHILPEIEATVGVSQAWPHYLDVFEHTLTALEAWMEMVETGFPDVSSRLQPQLIEYLQEPLAGNLSRQMLMPLAVLFHDSGKPLTRSEEDRPGRPPRIRFLGHEQESARLVRRAMVRLRFSTQATTFVQSVVAHHMRPLLLARRGRLSRRAIYRLFRDTEAGHAQAGVAVALHALADHRATYPPGQGRMAGQALRSVVDQLLSAYFEQYHQIVDPPPLLTGHELIAELGLKEGRLIGLLLTRLKEAQASGQIKNKTEAWTFIQQLLNSELKTKNGQTDNL
uniref:Polynucleotide adenylyltransferase region n=1 Tax=uncultured Chloroflexota bacterium TaxID=166587 RepID=H5SN23_9CHLR|nr:polynucleotide adenylyltransferase region [uncultured Chloroflexota bacterium]